MNLNRIQLVKKNEVNEVTVCRDMEDSSGALYSVVEVHDHEVVRKFLSIYRETGDPDESDMTVMHKDGVFCVVFPYVKERPLSAFYRGDSVSLNECEEICINTILACMTAKLPWPILYLVLAQGQVHLSRDNNVYLGYEVDLADLDIRRNEHDCTVQCARLILGLLESKSSEKAMSFLLLQKKISKSSYRRFTELYKDVRIAASPKQKKGIWNRIKAWYYRNKDTMFRILLVISVILMGIALVSILTQLIFGDVPWLRFFIRSFEHIGTESLLQ